jgi:hypothetical protein
LLIEATRPARSTFGLIPIYGNDVWLHALLAIAAGLIGFTNVFARRAVV